MANKKEEKPVEVVETPIESLRKMLVDKTKEEIADIIISAEKLGEITDEEANELAIENEVVIVAPVELDESTVNITDVTEKPVEVVDEKGKDINNDVIDTEEPTVPDNFVELSEEDKESEVIIGRSKGLNKKEYGHYKGRKYKVLKNGYGLWADNGETFVISDLGIIIKEK